MTKPPDIPPEKIFEQFEEIFGDLFGARAAGPRRGADLRVPLELTQTEAARGVRRRIEVPRRTPCVICRGHGGLPGGEVSSCAACGGSGKVLRAAGAFQMTSVCGSCKGRKVTFSRPCTVCDGTGGNETRAWLEVVVPPGVSTGQKLRLKGQGQRALPAFGADSSEPDDAPAGDLYLDLVVKDPSSAPASDERETLLARELAATPPASRGTLPAEARIVAAVAVGLALCVGYWLLSSR